MTVKSKVELNVLSNMHESVRRRYAEDRRAFRDHLNGLTNVQMLNLISGAVEEELLELCEAIRIAKS